MNWTTAGARLQMRCFGCNNAERQITATVRDHAVCPDCETRYNESSAFRCDLNERAIAANSAMMAELLGITPEQFTEAAKSAGPNISAFRAYVARWRQ